MFFRLSAFCAAFIMLSACSAMIDVHGDDVDPEALALLTPGETPYTEVQRILGSPSSKTIFDSENWIYMLSKQERIAFFKPEETERKLIVLKFSHDGILQKIETKTLEDGRNIIPNPALTKSDEDSTLTILDQMISNVGHMGTDAPVH